MFGFKFFKHQDEAAPNELEGEFITARLNARLQPVARGEYFEDPLDEMLKDKALGAVTGGGTQLADDPDGIAFVDLEILVETASDAAISAIIERLEAMGAPKGSTLIVEASGLEIPFGAHEGLALFLNGTDLPDDVYASCDINFVIAELDRLMGEAGAVKGNWQGSSETALYCYGPSFSAMRAAIEGFVASYPLCARSRLVQIA